jgi:hypothetical protein
MSNRLCTALAAAGAFATLAVAGPAQAQPYGMMNGYGPGYGMGPGYMMGPGYGGYGPGYGMMGPGYGPGYGQGPGYGPGAMMGYPHGTMMGPGYGYHGPSANQGNLNLSVDDVKTYLQRTIRNPNLKVGDVKEKDADTITADVVTKEGNSLVQRFDFNRHSGFYQPEQ